MKMPATPSMRCCASNSGRPSAVAELGGVRRLSSVFLEMKLKVSAPTTVLEATAGDRPITDPTRLAALDGVSSGECFSDYLLDDPETKTLPSRGVSGGYLRFRFRADLKQLW